MNKHLRNHVASLFLLAPCAGVMLALPATAVAQNAPAEIRSVNVLSDGGLEPGARLTVRVTGSPRARAVVRLPGVRERIELSEVTRGVYIGRYLVKRGERIDEDAEGRATIRLGNRSETTTFTLAEVLNGGAPVAVAPPAPPAPPPAPLRIERFGVAPFDRLEPGTELRFALEGVPGATVVVDLPGVANDVGLREIRPGHYEGSYTLRRTDNLNPQRPIVATLRQGDRNVVANLLLQQAQPAGDNRPPGLANMAPREGEVVPGGPNIQVAANFEDHGGSGVDPATVRISLNGQNVTQDSQVTPTGFSYRGALAPGHYTVAVTARDRAGNTVRRDWGFDVAAAAPVSLPLQVTSHGNNAQVGGGATMVQGRTAPFASVAVTVDGVAPVPGGFSVAQRVNTQIVQADANGNFAFSFTPRYQIPGARYDIEMMASKANVNSDAKLVLYQR